METGIPTPLSLPSLDPINLLVGKGIQAFAVIEFGLGVCFAAMFAPADPTKAVAVFHAIRTFDGKLAALEALAQLVLAEHERSEWSNIMTRVRSDQKARNKLAHWNASLYPGANSHEEVARMRPALVPPIWSDAAMRTLWGTDQPLTVKQLESIEAELGKSFVNIIAFTERLGSRLGVRPLAQMIVPSDDPPFQGAVDPTEDPQIA